MKALRVIGCVLIASCALGACQRKPAFLDWGGTGQHAQGHAQVGGEVVSTVDGVAITVAQVQALVNESGLSPRAALTRLQSEALLEGEATRRGYADHAAVADVARKALVQALLARDVESERATDAEIAAEYAKQDKRFHVPERREATHLLVRPVSNGTAEDENIAHSFAEKAAVALSNTTDYSTVFTQLAQFNSPHFTLRVEKLPAVAHDGSFVKEFEDALFAVDAVGAVPGAVHSEFGWHAIYLTKILPPVNESLAQATPVLAREIAIEKRRKKLASLTASLRDGTRVTDDRKGQKALGEIQL